VDALRDLGADAVDVTNDIAVTFRRSWAIAQTPPYHVYLKALYELHRQELELPELEPGRRGGCFTASRHDDRPAIGVEELRGKRWVEQTRRCRRWHRSRPWRPLPRRERRPFRFARFPPRNPPDPFRRRTTPLRDPGDHRVVSEHPLHPGQYPSGPVPRGRITTPEPELTAGGGAEVVGPAVGATREELGVRADGRERRAQVMRGIGNKPF